MLARAIHRQSARADHPFVVTNCPTLSEELLASELFGHVKGAFTGAVSDQAGRVEAAEGGTLFLDEIGEISPGLQIKLLRFLQEKDYERVGDTRQRHADVRVIAATNRDLEADVKAGRFREDLFYRINVVEVRMPPLARAARGHPAARARASWPSFTRATRPVPPELSPAAAQMLEQHDWPGNVRELRNAIERVAILWPVGIVEPEAFPHRLPRRVGQAAHDRRRLHRRRDRARAHPDGARADRPRSKRRRRCWASTPRRCGASASVTTGPERALSRRIGLRAHLHRVEAGPLDLGGDAVADQAVGEA